MYNSRMSIIEYEVPFFSNTPDDTHCFQAFLRMVLKYFEPEKDFTWRELDRLTAKRAGLWTWPLAGMMWMSDRGYEVVDVEEFDYGRFVEEREGYLLEFYGSEGGAEQIAHSDIDQEVAMAQRLLQSGLVTKGLPTLEMVGGLLDEGYLAGCLVNSRRLNGKNGYVGHFVLVKGMGEEGLTLHDPGLPPAENRPVSFGEFEQAWAAPDEKAKNVMGFRWGR